MLFISRDFWDDVWKDKYFALISSSKIVASSASHDETEYLDPFVVFGFFVCIICSSDICSVVFRGLFSRLFGLFFS